MRSFKKNLFLSFTTVLFLSCTGNQGKNPGESDAIYGRYAKSFFNTTGPQSANVILTSGPGTPAAIFYLVNGVASPQKTIDSSSLQFSSDLSVITVIGQPGIYEYSKAPITSILNGSVPLPAATVDVICNQFSYTGFTGLKVVGQNGMLSFLGVNQNGNSSLDNGGAVTKTESGKLISFQESGGGSLQIDTNSPTAADSSFFNAAFIEGNSFSLTCHLNNVPVLAGEQIPSVTTTSSSNLTSHILFTTNAKFSGNLGGLIGADAKCTAAAALGSKTKSIPGTWRAILSTSTTNANDHITLVSGAPVLNTNGDTIVPTGGSLWSGTISNPVGYDENGTALVVTYTETGSFRNGVANPVNCVNWTSGSNSDSMETGLPFTTDSTWLEFSNKMSCNSPGSLYCINSAN